MNWQSHLKEAWHAVWHQLRQNLRERGWLTLVIYLLFVLLTWPILYPNDRAWLDRVRFDDGESFAILEDFLAVAGDFFWFNIVWFAAFLWWAIVRKKQNWYRLALVFLLSGTMAGLLSRVVKMTAGRARPSMTDQSELTYRSFVGPNWKAKTHGYPSGHAAGSMGSASALFMAAPKVGWPALLFATGVSYSRMYGNHHFPMDSTHGAAMGIACGYLVARRPKKALKKP